MKTEHQVILTNVGFTPEHLEFLGKALLQMRASTGRALSRAAMLRGIVSAIAESELDLSQCSTEAEIRCEILRQLSHRSTPC